MGDYRKYRLIIDIKDHDQEIDWEAIVEESKRDTYNGNYLRNLFWLLWDETKLMPVDGDIEYLAKWYDHEKDMCRLSKKFPYIFSLYGQREFQKSKKWIKHFIDGKMFKQTSTRPPRPPWNEYKPEFNRRKFK